MTVSKTTIPGLFFIQLDVIEDERGSFREAWQNEKMSAAGLPEFQPVQCNVSESKRGVIRGIHAEPWNKYIHLVYGEGVSVIVDLRKNSETFKAYEMFEMNTSTALFVPKGLGNSFQATSPIAVYSYLVTEHWRPGGGYSAIAFNDPTLAIPWPITGSEQIVSEKDLHAPHLLIE